VWYPFPLACGYSGRLPFFFFQGVRKAGTSPLQVGLLSTFSSSPFCRSAADSSSLSAQDRLLATRDLPSFQWEIENQDLRGPLSPPSFSPDRELCVKEEDLKTAGDPFLPLKDSFSLPIRSPNSLCMKKAPRTHGLLPFLFLVRFPPLGFSFSQHLIAGRTVCFLLFFFPFSFFKNGREPPVVNS